MRNESARGAEILTDGFAGGAAGAMFGGLIGYGVTDQVLRDVERGGDRIMRLIARNPRLRRNAAIMAGLAGAGVGGVVGGIASGGGRWVHGSPRPKTAMALPGIKSTTSFGLSKGPIRKAGITAAALPKMRAPSGLAAEHLKPPKIGAAVHKAIGFAKAASIRSKKASAEHSSTMEARTGDLDNGAPLGAALESLIRQDDSRESPGIIREQLEYRRIHGHDNR